MGKALSQLCDRTAFQCAGEKQLSMTVGLDSIAEGSVVRVARCVLKLTPRAWAFAARHEAAIAAHWEQRRLESSKLYDGVVHLLCECALAHNVVSATFLRTNVRR